MSNDNANNLIPVPGQNVPALSRSTKFDGSEVTYGIQTSLDLATPEGKLALMNAVQGDSFGSNDVLNTEIAIRDIVAYGIDMVDKETGEVVKAIRTVVITTDGNSVAFVSRGIYRSCCWLAYAYGPPPWPNGIVCRVNQVALNDGKRTFKLVPIVKSVTAK